MRNFKRTLLKAAAFLGSILLLTVLITEPYFQSEMFHYQDAHVRDSFAGTLDTLICGSSHAYRAVMPTVFDARMGTSSYNLSTSLQTMSGRYELLKKELDRNPVELVILDASLDSFTRNRAQEGPEGDLYQLGRYNNIFERASYFFRHIRLEEYWQVYYDTLDRSKQTIGHLLRAGKTAGSSVKYETRGFLGAVTVPAEPIAPEEYHSVPVNTQIDWECKHYMDKMLALCKERNIPVVVVVAPVAQSVTLRYEGMDIFYGYLVEYCRQWQVPLFDFNLFRGKTGLFPDKTHYYDELHMSEAGGWSLTHYLCDVLQLWQAGEDCSDLFYDSYAQAEEAALNGTDIFDSSYKAKLPSP